MTDHALCTKEQFDRLARGIRQAYETIPFYRERYDTAGVKPDDITTYDDLVKLPMITKPEVIEDQERQPPFGSQLAVAPSELSRIYCNAGSLYLWYTAADMEAITSMFSEQFETLGVGPDDIVDVSSSFHWLMAGTIMDLAIRRIGAAVIPGGPGMSELRMKIMRTVGVTALEAFTPYAEELASRFGDYGIDPERDLQVRLLIIGGELRQREARARLEAAWGGAAVREFYGASEAGMVSVECLEVGDGMHLSPECVIEVINPDTGEHVALGEPGEIITTELYRSAQRFIRYRTGDITEGVIFEPCACGRPTLRLRRILGRNSDLARVKGLFVAPAVVEHLVRAHPGTGRWHVTVERPSRLDEMLLRVEHGGGAAEALALRTALVGDVKGAIGLTCEVETVPLGTLNADGPAIEDRRDFR